MRAEGPIDWTVQTLVIGPDEYVAIHLPDDVWDAEIERVKSQVVDAWPGVRVLFFVGDVKITAIEQEHV